MSERTKETDIENQTYVIGKLGGSVITDKTRLRTPSEPAIEAFSRAFGTLPADRRRRVVLAAGGGSFGHATAHPEFEPDAPDRLAASAPVFHEWAGLFEKIWHRAGPPCRVLNADALLKDGGAGVRWDPSPLRALLADGITPVLMPGIVFQQGRANLVSSDLLPLFVARTIKVSRYAALSDVSGLMIGGKTAASISSRDRKLALDAATNAVTPDVTGGMRRKLRIMLRLAAHGIEGVICSGRPELLENALFASPPPGTWIRPSDAQARRPIPAVA
jgi:isopentenyl phosphate kinase